MNRKNRVWFLALAFALLLWQVVATPLPVSALSVEDYLDIEYSVKFIPDEVQVGEAFYLVAEGKATCVKDVPIVDDAAIVGDIIARYDETGDEWVLESGYDLTIEEFPKKEGDTYELDKQIKLRFPGGSPLGDYTIIWEVTRVLINDRDFTEVIEALFPSYMSRVFGSVTLLAGEERAAEEEEEEENGEEEVVDEEEGDEEAAAPGFFVLSNLGIVPARAVAGQAVTISIGVTNEGGSEDSYTLHLMIDGALEESREVTLAPQESRTVAFQITRDAPGSYNVLLNGLRGDFIVVESGPGVWLHQHWYYVVIIVMVVVILCLLFFLL